MKQQFIAVTETALRLMALDAELAKKFLRDYGSYENRVEDPMRRWYLCVGA